MDQPRRMESQGRRITVADDLRGYAFIAPFMAVFLIFIGYPLFYSFWISLHEATIYSDFYNVFGTMRYVGGANYARTVHDPEFWWSLVLTFIYATLTIFPGMAMSLVLAVFLSKKGRLFGFLRSGFFLPNVFDVYVVGVIWLLIFNPSGFLQPIFGALGFDTLAKNGVLGYRFTTLPAIALAMVLKNAGFGMVLFLTSLSNMNESVFEAADVDGATPWQKLRHITIPLLRPIIFFLTVTGLVGTLNAFSEIYAMTDDTGGPTVGSAGGASLSAAKISGYYLFKAFNSANYGDAAAISFLLLIFALLISGLSYKLMNPKD
ncbi:sugar ABC transporter permease [soil metagenome]